MVTRASMEQTVIVVQVFSDAVSLPCSSSMARGYFGLNLGP